MSTFTIKQAIRTKYHGPTNARGARMSARCEAGIVFVGYDHGLSIEENHKAAFVLMLVKASWDGCYRAGVFQGDYYWVAV